MIDKKLREEAIGEIGMIIHARYSTILGKKLTPKEILQTWEFIHEFQPRYPAICKILDI